MSNICHNRLEVSGNKAVLQHFIEVFFGENVSLPVSVEYLDYRKTFLPPVGILVEQNEYFNRLGISPEMAEEDSSSPLNNWWDKIFIPGGWLYDVTAYMQDSTLIIGFVTRDFPPGLWIEKIAAAYPNLRIDCYYFEFLRAFVGRNLFINGREELEEFSNGEPEWSEMMKKYFDYEVHEITETEEEQDGVPFHTVSSAKI